MSSILVASIAFAGSACVAEVEIELDAEVDSTAAALQTPVPSMDGLPGFYVRVPMLGLPGEPVTMWLDGETNPDGTTSSGAFVRTVAPLYEVQTGDYHAIPNNPAIGWAAITFLVDTDGEPAFDVFLVDGILRDALGRISTLQMRAFGPDGEPGLPFLMQRVM